MATLMLLCVLLLQTRVSHRINSYMKPLMCLLGVLFLSACGAGASIDPPSNASTDTPITFQPTEFPSSPFGEGGPAIPSIDTSMGTSTGLSTKLSHEQTMALYKTFMNADTGRAYSTEALGRLLYTSYDVLNGKLAPLETWLCVQRNGDEILTDGPTWFYYFYPDNVVDPTRAFAIETTSIQAITTEAQFFFWSLAETDSANLMNVYRTDDGDYQYLGEQFDLQSIVFYIHESEVKQRLLMFLDNTLTGRGSLICDKHSTSTLGDSAAIASQYRFPNVKADHLPW